MRRDDLQTGFWAAKLYLTGGPIGSGQPGASSWQPESHHLALSWIRSRCMWLVSRTRKGWLKPTLCFLFFCVSLQAQTVQFLPEVDGYLKLSNMFRVYYQAKD